MRVSAGAGSGAGGKPHPTDVVDLKLQHDGIHAPHSADEVR